MDIAVEHQSDNVPVHIDQRTAGVAADDVIVAGEIEARLHVQLRFGPRATSPAP